MPERNSNYKNLSRQLRKNATDAELKLWQRIRSRHLGGYKFRRQLVIEPYIVDFCSLEQQLIVECDGGQHAQQEEKDSIRTDFLQDKGFRVLRYWNNDILLHLDDVLGDILRHCNK